MSPAIWRNVSLQNYALAVDVEFTQLVREYRPMGRAEEVLVREMARHVVALAHAEKAEPSVLAMSATMVADIKDTDGDSGLDSALRHQ